MNSNQVYPKHIYEPIRIEIATSYIKSEFRKLFPKVIETAWKDIDKDIDDWFKENESVGSARNFWNGIHGIAMGFKLKNTLLQILTAENIKWRLEKELVLDNRVSSGGSLLYIDKRLFQDKPRASDLRVFFSKNQNRGLAEKWKNEFKRQAKSSESREDFPIIAEQINYEGDLIYSIHDGNRRMILKILEGGKSIPAYLGEYITKDKKPLNYWIPTSLLMDILYFARQSYKKEDKVQFSYYMGVLKDVLSKSESAVYEVKKRALTSQQPFRDDVLKSLELL